jgi:hypothetical protein
MLAVVSLTVAASLAACGGEVTPAPAPNPAATATVQAAQPAETPGQDISDAPATPTASTASQSDAPAGEIGVGQTGEINGIMITLNSIRHQAEGAVAPMEGYEYIVLNLTFENTTGVPVMVGSFMDEVTVKDDAGEKYRDSGMADLEATNLATDGGMVQPNETLTGELALEVPADAMGLIVEYELTTADGNGQLTFKLDR